MHSRCAALTARGVGLDRLRVHDSGCRLRVTVLRPADGVAQPVVQFGVPPAGEEGVDPRPGREAGGHRPSRTVPDPAAVRLKAGRTLTVTETALVFLEDARRRGGLCRPLEEWNSSTPGKFISPLR